MPLSHIQQAQVLAYLRNLISEVFLTSIAREIKISHHGTVSSSKLHFCQESVRKIVRIMNYYALIQFYIKLRNTCKTRWFGSFDSFNHNKQISGIKTGKFSPRGFTYASTLSFARSFAADDIVVGLRHAHTSLSTHDVIRWSRSFPCTYSRFIVSVCLRSFNMLHIRPWERRLYSIYWFMMKYDSGNRRRRCLFQVSP